MQTQISVNYYSRKLPSPQALKVIPGHLTNALADDRDKSVAQVFPPEFDRRQRAINALLY
jgi:hypothetical protein